MKNAPLIALSLFALLFFSCKDRNPAETASYVPGAGYIQIVMFHLEQRCESCNAVERETLFILENEYKDEMLSGEVKFVPLSFTSENGKSAAKRLRASGQTLYVIKGDSIQNLTSPAFMFASTHPELYRKALREALDKYLE